MGTPFHGPLANQQSPLRRCKCVITPGYSHVKFYHCLGELKYQLYLEFLPLYLK